MRMEAPAREELPIIGVWGTQEGTKPEPIDRWIARTLLKARGTSPRPLEDLKLTVGYEVHREILRTIGPSGLTHVFGAEFEVDHELAVPFVLTWVTGEEKAVERLKQRYGDDITIVSGRDWRRLW